MTRKDSELRVGIVGLGSIAEKVYLPLLSRHTDVDLVGIASRRPETAQNISEKYRITDCFNSLDGVLAQDPEIVFIHASTPAHFELIAKCVDAGKHVYVDKPLTDQIDTTNELVDRATSKGLLLAVGFNRRFAPFIQRARDAVPIADVVTIEKHRMSLDSHSARATVYDDLIHLIDTLVWTLGDVAQVVDWQQRCDHEGRLVSAVGTLKCGEATGQFTMNRQSGSDFERMTFGGDGHFAEVVNLEQLTTSTFDPHVRTSNTTTLSFGSWDTIQYRRGFVNLIDHVLDHLDDPESCLVNATRTMRTHQIVDELTKS